MEYNKYALAISINNTHDDLLRRGKVHGIVLNNTNNYFSVPAKPIEDYNSYLLDANYFDSVVDVAGDDCGILRESIVQAHIKDFYMLSWLGDLLVETDKIPFDHGIYFLVSKAKIKDIKFKYIPIVIELDTKDYELIYVDNASKLLFNNP